MRRRMGKVEQTIGALHRALHESTAEGAELRDGLLADLRDTINESAGIDKEKRARLSRALEQLAHGINEMREMERFSGGASRAGSALGVFTSILKEKPRP
jgi:truncated hemoglobin YjbI